MPRKNRFTREEILAAALYLTQEKGIAAVTARGLGERLGTSSKPVFGQFENMEAVQRAVIVAAEEEYNAFLRENMAAGKYPPYKASGMAYIRFARQERELFKLLFMRDRSGEVITEDRESIAPLIALIRKNLGISEEEAYRFHLEMWVYVHGIATLLATSYLDWDEACVSRALTDAYNGMKHCYQEGNPYGSH